METVFDHDVTPEELRALGLGGLRSKEEYLDLLRWTYSRSQHRNDLVSVEAWVHLVRLAEVRQDAAWRQRLLDSNPEYRRYLIPL